MTFIEPVSVGELLSCSAMVNAVWRTSMEVGVRVEAENPFTRERRHTSTAYLTMVALDAEGHPFPVPPLLTSTRGRGAPPPRGRAAPRQPAREREQILEHRAADRRRLGAGLLARSAQPDLSRPARGSG